MYFGETTVLSVTEVMKLRNVRITCSLGVHPSTPFTLDAAFAIGAKLVLNNITVLSPPKYL